MPVICSFLHLSFLINKHCLEGAYLPINAIIPPGRTRPLSNKFVPYLSLLLLIRLFCSLEEQLYLPVPAKSSIWT